MATNLVPSITETTELALDITSVQSVSAPPKTVSPYEASQFAQLMEKTTTPVSDIDPVGNAVGNTLGDHILDGLSKVGTDFSTVINKVSTALNTPNATTSAAELLGIQMTMAEKMFKIDFVTKVVTKGADGVNQLTHMQ